MMNVLGLYPCQNKGLMEMIGINTDRVYVRENIMLPDDIMLGFDGIQNNTDELFTVVDNDGNRVMTLTQNSVSFFGGEFVINRRNYIHQ